MEAAYLSQQESLPLADSVVLATAQALDAAPRTQNLHFEGLDDVHFIAKR